MCVCIYVCLCLYMFVCVCVCICVYVCGYLCVCVCLHTGSGVGSGSGIGSETLQKVGSGYEKNHSGSTTLLLMISFPLCGAVHCSASMYPVLLIRDQMPFGPLDPRWVKNQDPG
jgi:hypothetical protein